MKTFVLSSILVLAISFVGLAGVRGPDSSGLTVVSASYGSGDRRIDVTQAVRSLVAHEVILLRAPWALGSKDPALNEVKDVRIVYRLNGTESTATFNQNQYLILPAKSEGLVIASASFGVRDSHVDVTEAVRAHVSRGELSIPARWFLGEVDPAFGSKKQVEIVYLLGGVLNTVSYWQDEDINFPKTAPRPAP